MVSGIILPAYLWLRVPKPGSLEFVRSMERAFQRRDAHLLAQFCDDSELKAYGISRQSLESLIVEEINPLLEATFDASRSIVTQYPDRIELYVSPKSGSSLLFGNRFTITTGESGPKALSFISNLIRLHSSKYFDPKTDSAAIRWLTALHQAENDGGKFAKIGIKGVYLPDTHTIETWSERKKICSKKLASMKIKF